MLHFEVKGSGVPVVFLHGFMEDTSMWNNLDRLKGIQSILVDLNGHGKSELVNAPEPSVELMAQQVIGIIQSIQLSTVQLVGHSLGGYVAIEIFNQVPEMIEHITLFHSHPWSDSSEKKLDRERVANLVMTKASTFIREAIPNLFFEPAKHSDAIRHYIDIACKMDPEAIAWSSRAMKNRKSNEQTLKNHPDRFTIVQGKHDKLIPYRAISDLCNSSSVSLMVLENSAHMGHVEETGRYLEILETILIEKP